VVSTHFLLISGVGGIPSQILVYKRKTAPLFRQRFSRNSLLPVTHHPSRKEFFARLAGIAALSGVLPRLFAKSGAGASDVKTSNAPAGSLLIRADPRAVARRAETT
jgi:hypothetical protein